MKNRPLKLGIAGLGTVGTSLVKVLVESRALLTDRCGREIDVVAVNARSRDKDRGIDLSAYEWFDTPQELATSADIDVFVELIGGEDGAALEASKAALAAGRHVVTANKAMLAKHGVELASLAEESGVCLTSKQRSQAASQSSKPFVRLLPPTKSAAFTEL